MRGSHVIDSSVRAHDGIIPADAGLTCWRYSRRHLSWDHPRGCGAHDFQQINTTVTTGSSPRMRGSHTHSQMTDFFTGIIPADAGLTGKHLGQYHGGWDHPRGCGAHFGVWTMPDFAKGSSPRMRGSPTDEHTTPRQAGIIPTDAGLTSTSLWAQYSQRDHPRGCGAHLSSIWLSIMKRGSSPRMRGSHASRINRQVNLGIIPADAGLTPTREPDQFMNRDHPRGCGAHYSPLSSNNICRGSSPRMRGSQRFIRR